ncbi:MAG: XRE family transcriptional regulator [Anaerolineae bacterium]|nr:XRE family transcriptional regulator [Anaerolineae bacterium]
MAEPTQNINNDDNGNELEFIMPTHIYPTASSRTTETEEPSEAATPEEILLDDSLVRRLTNLTGDVTMGALKLAVKAGKAPVRLGKTFIGDADKLKMMKETGSYLADLRKLAGLTISDLSDALDLEDKTFLEAVENGTATLSFELILRSAALLARHDPVPFVMRMTRTYNPTIWSLLDNWGMGRLPLQYERERQFVNIYRRHDAARKLSDESFAHIMQFTQSAFEMALHYAIEQEGITDKILDIEEEEKKNKKSQSSTAAK